MDIKIREAKEEDIKALYKLNKENLGYDYPIAKMQINLIKILKKTSDKIFVALIEEEVVGYLHLQDYELLYSDSLKNVLGIAVKTEYQRLGVGKALLAQGEKWAKAMGAKVIRLNSGSSRKSAHQFYQKYGYLYQNDQCKFIKRFES